MTQLRNLKRVNYTYMQGKDSEAKSFRRLYTIGGDQGWNGHISRSKMPRWETINKRPRSHSTPIPDPVGDRVPYFDILLGGEPEESADSTPSSPPESIDEPSSLARSRGDGLEPLFASVQELPVPLVAITSSIVETNVIGPQMTCCSYPESVQGSVQQEIPSKENLLVESTNEAASPVPQPVAKQSSLPHGERGTLKPSIALGQGPRVLFVAVTPPSVTEPQFAQSPAADDDQLTSSPFISSPILRPGFNKYGEAPLGCSTPCPNKTAPLLVRRRTDGSNSILVPCTIPCTIPRSIKPRNEAATRNVTPFGNIRRVPYSLGKGTDKVAYRTVLVPRPRLKGLSSNPGSITRKRLP